MENSLILSEVEGYGPTPRCRSHHLKSVAEGIALVDEDGVDAVLPRPAGEAGANGGDAADLRRALDATLEEAADDALVHEFLADAQLALGGEMRHARRGAGATRRAVDRAVAVEDGVAAMRRLVARRAGPHDVADTGDAGIVGMCEADLLAHQLPHDGAEAQDGVGR